MAKFTVGPFNIFDLDHGFLTTQVQAATGSKIWARGDVKPYRKDVLAKLKTVRGDEGRVQKLLKNQKKGKARMRSIGNIEVSKDIFIKMLT